MPEFSLKTEFESSAKAVIVDEKGDFVFPLLKKLLGQDFFVYFFSEKKEGDLDKVDNKEKSIFLKSISEIENIPKIDYFFYFPSKENLIGTEKFFELSKKHSCRFLIVCQTNLPEFEKFRFLVEEKNINARLVVFESVFGERMVFGFLASVLENLFKKIPVSPSLEIYLLSIETFIDQLNKLILSPKTKGKAYFIYNQKILLGDLVNSLKKDLPIEVVLEEKEEGRNFEIKGLEELKIEENFEEKLREVLIWFYKKQQLFIPSVEDKGEEEKNKPYDQKVILEQESKISEKEESRETKEESSLKVLEVEVIDQKFSKKEEKQNKKTTLSRKIIFGISIFLSLWLVFFALPLVTAGLFSFWGLKEMEKGVLAFKQGNFFSAEKKNDSSEKFFHFSQKILLSTSPFYGLMGLGESVEKINQVLQFSQNLNETFHFSLLASQDLFKWGKKFLEGEGGDEEEHFNSIKTNLSKAYEEASLAQSSLTNVEGGFRLLRQGSYYEKLKTLLPQMRETFIKGQSLISIFPKVLGFSGRKTYLVLFQNNAELRPTGGFIGSYALVTLENGQLINFEIFDVYQADGQLKGHVEPPAKLKQYLGEANWYLRDSNWDPDFPVSAQRAQWFLDKEMQATTDGVVGVTLSAAQKVVGALGEIEVLDYQEKINEKNLFQKAEYYSELGSFPGSVQKKEFLSSLYQSLFEEIRKAKEDELIKIGNALFSSLEEKEILLYFNESEIQKVAASLNWSGGIREYQPKTGLASAFSDYLFINEANVGINKANYFLERKVDHQIILTKDGRVEEKLTLSYENLSPSNNWPAGPYKTYLRLYLPKGTKVTSILITDLENSNVWVPFEWQYFDISEEHGKALFGFFFEVPIQKKRVLEIKYELPKKIDLSKRLNSYLLLVQKQSGSHPSSYTLNFVYPENFIPVRVIPSAIVGERQLLVKDKLNKDLIFQIDLAH